jgi:hypothetical protein
VLIEMTDEAGRLLASGEGQQFLKSLVGGIAPRELTPMREMGIPAGFEQIPMLKANMTPAEEADRVIALAQQRFGRCQVLRRLEELGLA